MDRLDWQYLLVFLAIAVLAVGLLLAFFRAAGRRLALTTVADEVLDVVTEDGHRLALHHYPPKQPRPGDFPVVLCHGLGANRFNLDFDSRYSLARYLQGRGYDVFVLELRGSGLSAPSSNHD